MACGEICSYQFYGCSSFLRVEHGNCTCLPAKNSASNHLHSQKDDFQVRYDFFLVDFLHETLKEDVARFLLMETQAGFEN